MCLYASLLLVLLKVASGSNESYFVDLGCTKQACGFGDRYEEIKSSGFDVVGVSMDAPANIVRFLPYWYNVRDLSFVYSGQMEEE